MLKRVDRIQIAGPSADRIASTFERLFGAVREKRDEVKCLNAQRITVRLGISAVEALTPIGAGPVEDFVNKWGEGLFGAGFSVDDLDKFEKRIEGEVTFNREGAQLFIEPTDIGGLRAVISPHHKRPPKPAGLITHIYEVTNPVKDYKAAVRFYTRVFGLDASRFHPIKSDLYGYTGMLTLFDPPENLDRIEVTQITDYSKAMGRFHERRGDSLYMFFAEVDDFDALKSRLESENARFAVREPADGAPNVLFVHPKSLHGVLMGVSLTGVAWDWSSDRGKQSAHA